MASGYSGKPHGTCPHARNIRCVTPSASLSCLYVQADKVARWRRIRTVRQEPSNDAVVAYSEIHMPLAYGSVIRHAKKSRRPFFSLIETLFHEKITDIQQEISCVARLAAAEAAHLQLPKASPGLQITRRYVGSGGHTLEFARSVHPAELFKYAMRLQLRHGA